MSLKKWNERTAPPNVKPEPSQNNKPDMVNHPSHYTEYPLENLETIRGSMSLIEYQGFLKGTALKYLYRYKLKLNPVEDLKKARFYQDRLIETLEEEKG